MIKKKSIAAGLLQSLREAQGHSEGKLELKENLRNLPGPAPTWKASKIRQLRKEIYHMSQEEFALLLNVKAPTIRSWEQGQKLPSGSAARLLEILSVDTSILKKLVAVS